MKHQEYIEMSKMIEKSNKMLLAIIITAIIIVGAIVYTLEPTPIKQNVSKTLEPS